MIRIPTRRARAVVLAFAMTTATVGTTVAVTAPAHAVNSTCTTKTKLTINSKGANQVVKWGDYNSVWVDVSSNCTNDGPTVPLGGKTILYKSTDGGRNWNRVTSSSAHPSYLSISGNKAITRNTIFRARFYHATDEYNNTYDTSTDYIRAYVYRKSSYNWTSVRRAVRYNFKISPVASIKGLKVVFKKKSGTRWVFLRSVRVSSRGHVVSTFGLGTYRMNLPAKRGMVASFRKFGVVRGRATTARATTR